MIFVRTEMKNLSLEQASKIIAGMRMGIRNLRGKKEELTNRNKSQQKVISILAHRTAVAEKSIAKLEFLVEENKRLSKKVSDLRESYRTMLTSRRNINEEI